MKFEIIIILISVISWLIYIPCIGFIFTKIEELREATIALLRDISESNKALDRGWNDALDGWGRTCEVNNQLLEMLKALLEAEGPDECKS